MLKRIVPNCGLGLSVAPDALLATPRSVGRRSMLAAMGAVAAGVVVPLRPARAEERADAAWRALAGDGAVAVVRHARAPGPSPDPPGFRLDDCATQRNLSAEGRAQAERLGALWRSRGAKAAKVISSPWCRCRDTARLMGFAEVETSDALWNLLHRTPDRDAKVAAARALVRDWRGPGALVLVTHGVMANALGLSDPGEGGIAVVLPDASAAAGYRLVGTIPPPAAERSP
jgi:phosphohistidine phosphatase SixA